MNDVKGRLRGIIKNPDKSRQYLVVCSTDAGRREVECQRETLGDERRSNIRVVSVTGVNDIYRLRGLITHEVILSEDGRRSFTAQQIDMIRPLARPPQPKT